MQTSNKVKRRTLLKGALAASAAGLAPFNILKAGPSPNSKLNIACIGVGGRGSAVAGGMAGTDNIVALCDVHESWHKAAIAKQPRLQGIKLWKDYREMFDKVGKEIDAVMIATPEHARFSIAMSAIRQGKHVYAEKPLCHTVNEIRLLAEEAAKNPAIVTQMGNQGHSSESAAQINDWVDAGTIGQVREVVAFSRKNYWIDKPLVQGSDVPDDLDWNLYLNRADEIPFSESYMNREWIRYRHFSGSVGDMGGHTLDAGYYSLGLTAPTSVRADVVAPATPWSMPRAGVVTWEFPARGDKPPVTMKYYLGTDIEFPRPKHLDPDQKMIDAGSFLVGEHGSIQAGSHSQGARLLPKSLRDATQNVSASAFRCKASNHSANWTLACKGEDKAMSSFDYAGPLSEVVVLGNIALIHPGTTLKWDAAKMEITNHEAANKSLFMRRIDPRDHLNWY
ncbi:Inositol 2-dehydrogenase [Planctomycetes bacterium CA13]|uniref:Inositol 2-dehydrogenase n=1 Tax=Novipirellula herctigrandis TaxID=2527986 RepID=A0A5C5YUY6_9BACT|nr:Inositol 2-dehydrogenase [Planctomycetes bacterium CA13]